MRLNWRPSRQQTAGSSTLQPPPRTRPWRFSCSGLGPELGDPSGFLNCRTPEHLNARVTVGFPEHPNIRTPDRRSDFSFLLFTFAFPHDADMTRLRRGHDALMTRT